MFLLICVLLLGAANVYCESTTQAAITAATAAPSYDQIVANKLAAIDSTRTTVSATVSTELPLLQSIQSATATLANTLPNAIVNDDLSDAISKLDAISTVLAGTTEAFCFQNYASIKSSILTQARQTYVTCTASQTTITNQLIADVNRNITTLNTLATTAKTRISACGNSAIYRVNRDLFNYCIATATAAYDAQLGYLSTGVASLQSLRTNNVNNVATCVANAVTRAETTLQSFNDYIKSCAATSSLNINFASIITNVQQTSTSTYSSQITTTTTTAAALTDINATATKNLNDATISVNAAITAKSLTYTSAKAALDKEFADVSSVFAGAADAFSTNVFARTCVNNIRSALPANLVKQANLIALCVQNIRSNTLASDLSSLRTSYNQQQATNSLIPIVCLGQIDYLFIKNGITQCRQYAESDATSNLTFTSYQALTLGKSAEMVSSAVDQCNSLGRTAVKRQYMKDKLSFETCILKNVRQAYIINV